MNEHLTELILPAVDAALLDIAANPGPLANRPRQIETFAKLQARQDSADFTSEQKALAYFEHRRRCWQNCFVRSGGAGFPAARLARHGCRAAH